MNLINTILHSLKKRPDNFIAAKKELLSSGKLNNNEKDLIKKVSLSIHPSDGMYVAPAAAHYLGVGLSAIRCIQTAIEKSNKKDSIKSILDFPCGYGRVLRFLRVRFPNADITASEIETPSMDFCKNEFSAYPMNSDKDFNKISTTKKFDLVWCGSLATHLDEKDTTDLLKFFYNVLALGGLCVFTTHGPTTIKWIQEKTKTYELTDKAQAELLAAFQRNGYGYADYELQEKYGISAVSYDRMSEIAGDIFKSKAVMYLERGWDNHQDVYCFSKKGA